jgi:phage major head subunit gpT-like protein
MPRETITIKCYGTQAHGSVCSWVGDNAIAKMVRILNALTSQKNCGRVECQRLACEEQDSASPEYCEAWVSCDAKSAEKLQSVVASLGEKNVEVCHERQNFFAI